MVKSKHTHSKGFNVTSLEGVSGIYIFLGRCGDVVYIGSCKDDFMRRLRSHTNKTNGKLSLDIQSIYVVITDPLINTLHVLEHLFIWYLEPPKNETLWFFRESENEKEVKQIAKEKNLHICGSLEKYLLSFETVLLKRELDENFEFIKYGKLEHSASKIAEVHCKGRGGGCLCYSCIVKRRKEEIERKRILYQKVKRILNSYS